jgi:hypothetical protein
MAGIEKLIFLVQKDQKFRDCLRKFIKEKEISQEELSYCYRMWKEFKEDKVPALSINEEFVKNFIPQKVKVDEKSIVETVAFLFLVTTVYEDNKILAFWEIDKNGVFLNIKRGSLEDRLSYEKLYPVTCQFLFFCKNLDEAFIEPMRLQTFFKNELKNFVTLIYRAIKIAPQISKFLDLMYYLESSEEGFEENSEEKRKVSAA